MSTFIFLDENNKLTQSTALNTSSIELSQGNITSAHGTINFNDEHLTTTGNVTGNIFSAKGLNIGNSSLNQVDTFLTCNSGIWQIGTNNTGNGTDNNNLYIWQDTYKLTVQKGSGNIGIGTTAPNEKLHVNGNIIIGETSYTNAHDPTNNSRLFFNYPQEGIYNYYIGTNKENYNGDFTKLDLRWHTGIRIGANCIYGGIRIYNDDKLNDNNLLFSIGKSVDASDSYNTIVEKGNLGIENGNIFFGGNPTTNSFDNIISFNNNKIISPKLLVSQHTDLGIAKDTNNTTHTSGEIHIELIDTATYKYDDTALESNNNLYYLALNTAAASSVGRVFLKYTRQIYHTPAPINIEFDVSWRGTSHGGDGLWVYLFPSTSAIESNTEGLRIHIFTYNGTPNQISFAYNNANSQIQYIPYHSIISSNYQKFRILITQEGLIHLYKNNTEILDNSNNPVIGNFSQTIKDNIINDLSNINKQSIMFRATNGDAFAQIRIKNVTISNHNIYNSIVKDENNNLGIGTSSPLEKLHVNGNIRANGTLVVQEGANSSSTIGYARIGYVGHQGNAGVSYAGFVHKDRAIGTDYAVLHDSLGNTFINCKSQTSIFFREANGDKMVLKGGNLGIGTLVSDEKLTIGGTNPSIHFNGDWDENNYFRIMGYNNEKKLEFNYNEGTILADNNAIIFKTGYNSSNQTHTERMRINNSGNLGIGTTSPSEKLHVNGNIKAEGALVVQEGADTSSTIGVCRIGYIGHHSHGGISYAGFAHKDRAIGTDYAFLHDSLGNTYINCKLQTSISFREDNSNKMVLKDGYLGIGTTSPTHPLHINVEKTDGVAVNSYYQNLNDLPTGGRIATTNGYNISVRIKGRLWMEDSLIIHSSDSRIKTNIVDIPDNLALEQLRNIPCRYYEYIDKLRMGIDKTIGFIAQEVKSVLPMAVSQEKNIIPNIYRIINCTWTSNSDKFTMMSSDLENVNGIKYKFYVSNTSDGSDEEKIEIVGNSDNTFTFDKQYTNVFCYGSEVYNFNILDKNKLYTLNFSATQEIDRIQQQHITKIETLETEVSTLKQENMQQQTEINTLKNELDNIKELLLKNNII